YFFFSSRRRHTRCYRDWSSDVCSSDLLEIGANGRDLPVDRGGREAQVLECVHELAQLSGRERVGPGRAPGRAMRREAPHVAEVEIGRASWRERGEGAGDDGDGTSRSKT